MVTALALAALAASAQPQPAAKDISVPVLIELFTSEGCSDCPPADRLLEEIDKQQPVPGAHVIVLSEHVTYWNHLGWSDPFSLPEMDARQQEYGSRFRLDSIYTPQAVVDGSAQVVGNNAAEVTRALASAASSPKKALAIVDAHWESGAAVFSVSGSVDPGARVVAIVASDATHSEVRRGENAGRTLHHVAVVRSIKAFGPEVAGRPLRLSGAGLSHDASAPARLVVFTVDRKTGHVTAAAEQFLNR